MTPRQAETLDFIKGYIAERGYSPSYSEIQKHLGLRSTSGVARIVASLEARGHITRSYGNGRCIELRVIRCPHCGGEL